MASADQVRIDYIPEVTAGVTPNNGTKASRVLTATANFANGETVTIGTKTYTFQTALTNVDGNVKIGATLQASLLNLARAINLSGGVPGTDYAALMTEHPDVEATSNATTLTATAKFVGTAYNSLATTETGTNASWAGATLTGGTNSSSTAWKQLRFNSESLKFEIENTQSEEIRPDRTQQDLIQTGASAAGDVSFELSYTSFDDFLEAALCGSWSSNVLINGTTRRFFTVRKNFQDLTPQLYHLFRGTCVEGFDIAFELGAIVKGNFNLVSFGIDPEYGIMTTTIAGETRTDAGTTAPMNAVTNFRDFVIGGVPYGGCITKMSMKLVNNLRSIKCLGSLNPRDMRLGTLEVTGDMEFHFNDSSVYDRFVKGIEFDVSYAMQDGVGNRYDFDMPRVKFETGEVVAGGKGTDVMVSASYRALYSAANTRVMRVVRTPAP